MFGILSLFLSLEDEYTFAKTLFEKNVSISPEHFQQKKSAGYQQDSSPEVFQWKPA
jgi:hypothetical protein